MDNQKDFIDLRDSAARENTGNGPPPMASGAAPPVPARKNGWIVALFLTLAALLLAVIITSVIMFFGFANFIRNTISHTATQTVTVTENQEIEAWANQFADGVMAWTDGIAAWAEDFAEAFSQTWTTFGRTQTWAAGIEHIELTLGTSHVRILPHNDSHIVFDGGGDNIFQVNYDIIGGHISVTDNQSPSSGTLTGFVPYNWQGSINIYTQGEVYISSDLPPGVIIN